MIDRIRALLTDIEEGSVNRAAVRLRITQPALSRQMQALENEIGGKLLERETSGVKPTGLGHALVKAMQPLVESYDSTMADLRRQARGERTELRVGTSALLRRVSHARARDAAQVTPRCTAQAARPLATKKSIALKDLKGRDFIGIDEAEMPGRNRWMTALCKPAGFKPRFIAIVEGLTNVLSHVVSESAVTLVPAYFAKSSHPGVAFVPINDPKARWDFIVLWQKGSSSAAARALVGALKQVEVGQGT